MGKSGWGRGGKPALCTSTRETSGVFEHGPLGPRPSKTTIVPAYQAGLGRYTCRCTECLRVQAFLRGAQSSETLERIGATKRKHVEQQIGACLGSLVTYSTITKSPQGLEVILRLCSRWF
jgi:hypothetical protein